MTSRVGGDTSFISDVSSSRSRSCSGRPCGNRPQAAPLTETQRAYLSGTLSGAGAVVAGAGCVTTGTTCVLAGVLAFDSTRQFSKAISGSDPVIDAAEYFGASRDSAKNIALGADFVTASVSIGAAYKGLLFRSIQPLSAGALGATSLDGASTINSISGLRDAVNTQ